MPKASGRGRRGRSRKSKVEEEVEEVETVDAGTNGDEVAEVPDELEIEQKEEKSADAKTAAASQNAEIETEKNLNEPENMSQNTQNSDEMHVDELEKRDVKESLASEQEEIKETKEIKQVDEKSNVAKQSESDFGQSLSKENDSATKPKEDDGEHLTLSVPASKDVSSVKPVDDSTSVNDMDESSDVGSATNDSKHAETGNFSVLSSCLKDMSADEYEEMETEEEAVLLLHSANSDDFVKEVDNNYKETDDSEVCGKMDVDEPQDKKSQQGDAQVNKKSLIKGKVGSKKHKHDEKKDGIKEPETETVSEDELPTEGVKQAPVSDDEAEEVSDDELPRTGIEDVLVDTEAVSDDELPPVKKRTREVKSESASQDNASKGQKRAHTTSESSDTTPAKKPAQETKPKALPELEKYWKAVREDPADFTGWTYLLQYVDQENDVEAAREAYDTFLAHYPYCYGYWRKYADYEKRKGDKSKSQDVFERGLGAIPLSVDLWLHYLNHIKVIRKDDEDYIRSQYERAIETCGIEFRSDRLWDNYIKWETELKNPAHVCSIYDRLFKVPTQGYKTHFENFEDFVMSHQPNKMLGIDEFLTLRGEVLQKLKQKPASESAPAANAPPGDESDEDADKGLTYADEETKLMREKIISIRKKVYKEMTTAVLDRWNFEEGIKRPYFHVKPLERCQLNNWRDYLDFEMKEGNQERSIVLFERCLIACALYDEFWVKYIRYLETLEGDEIKKRIRDVYTRACTIHHPKKPMLALNWAYFEESQNDVDASRKILERIEADVPNSLQIAVSRINLERRNGSYEEAARLYEQYIGSYKSKYLVNALSIKFARFCQKVLGDIDRGVDVIRKAIDKDKDNPRLYHQLLDLVFSRESKGAEKERECVAVMDQFLERSSADLEHKVLLAQHKVEFLEDFGSTSSCVQTAVTEYLALLKLLKDKRRKQFEEKGKEDSKKGKSESTTPSTGTAYTGTTTNSGSYSTSTYSNSGSSQQYGSSYGQPPFNQYNSQSDPGYNNYQNWNYSQTGYNNYNQTWGNYNYY